MTEGANQIAKLLDEFNKHQHLLFNYGEDGMVEDGDGGCYDEGSLASLVSQNHNPMIT